MQFASSLFQLGAVIQRDAVERDLGMVHRRGHGLLVLMGGGCREHLGQFCETEKAETCS